MKAFSYVTAQTADTAVELVREQGRFLAGGMDLLGEMKEGLVEPAVLVNVKALPGTREVTRAKAHWSRQACSQRRCSSAPRGSCVATDCLRIERSHSTARTL